MDANVPKTDFYILLLHFYWNCIYFQTCGFRNQYTTCSVSLGERKQLSTFLYQKIYFCHFGNVHKSYIIVVHVHISNSILNLPLIMPLKMHLSLSAFISSKASSPNVIISRFQPQALGSPRRTCPMSDGYFQACLWCLILYYHFLY